jgi:hypothetical protein
VILPHKHLPVGLSLLGIGAQIIAVLDRPLGVDQLWERSREERGVVSFDRFCAALTFLYVIGLLDLDDEEMIVRGRPG